MFLTTSSLTLPLANGKGTKPKMSQVHNNHIFKERRIELRQKATTSEEKLWFCLRNNKLGVKFKRQHNFGGYILDFYCANKKLIIELDGEIHGSLEAKEYDIVRDKFFKELGYLTLRFLNKEVESNIENVLKKISDFLSSPSPLQGEGRPSVKRSGVR